MKKGIDRTKRDTILLKVLNERLSYTKKLLKEYESELKKARSKKDTFLIESHNYTVGYLTGEKVSLEIAIDGLKSSAEDLAKNIEEDKKTEAKNKAYLDKIFKDIFDGKSRKIKRKKL